MQIKMSHKKLNNEGKVLAGVVVLLAILAAGGVLWWHFGHNKKMVANDAAKPPAQTQPRTKSPASNDNPSGQDNSNSPAASGNNSNISSNTTTGSSSTTESNSGKTKVSPVISTAGPISPNSDGNVVIRGGVQGVVESGGTCTLKLINGNKTVTATKSSFVSGTTTTCGAISVPYGNGSNQVSKGTWQVTLSYSSSDAYGTSSTISIVIN